jgi:hypothetical protein
MAGAAVGQATLGPDVIVGDLHNLLSHGSVTVGSQRFSAFSVGTTSCNRGNTPVNWYDDFNSTPNIPASQWNWHPVIGLNLFRHKSVNGAGQFDMIGMSWLKQGFTALQGNACTLGCTANPNGDRLGVGCSDPYGASLNGSQGTGDLGPRSDVNAHTGVFPFPVVYAPSMTIANALSRRIVVNNNDLDTAQNTGALYYAEGHYVTQDDAQYVNGAGNLPVGAMDNDNNNVSYRRVAFTQSGTGTNLSFTVAFVAGQATQRERGAIYAWATAETGVTVNTFDIPNEGRFVVGYKVTPIAGGLYHYEYAISNINSDRSGYALRLNYPAGRGSSVAPTNIGFNAPDYHSGEIYDNTDWVNVSDATGIEWHSPQSFAQNPNTNALRYMSTYSFRFDSPRPPVAGNATFTLFKPGAVGDPDSVSIPLQVPQPTPCDIDFNNDGLFPDTADIGDLLFVFSGGACPTASCDSIDFNGDGLFPDTQDVEDFLAIFAGAPCV